MRATDGLAGHVLPLCGAAQRDRTAPAANRKANREGLSHWRPEVNSLTTTEKLDRVMRALDDRARGLLDPESLVDTLLAILAGQDPYELDVDMHSAWEPAPR
jgi:hypothetical protein